LMSLIAFIVLYFLSVRKTRRASYATR
jgi:hypothetical protein